MFYFPCSSFLSSIYFESIERKSVDSFLSIFPRFSFQADSKAIETLQNGKNHRSSRRSQAEVASSSCRLILNDPYAFLLSLSTYTVYITKEKIT